MTRETTQPDKKRRREEAAQRESTRADRSATEQLENLDGRLGKNVGARRERGRLA